MIESMAQDHGPAATDALAGGAAAGEMREGPGPTEPPAHVTPQLLVNQVSKYYRQFEAVQDVSFAVSPGEVVGLVGPNGAGKTTILRCAAGVLRPTAGTVVCAGHDMICEPHLAKPQVSLVPETPNLYELLTVQEHLRFIHMAYGEQTDFAAWSEYLLDTLDLTEKTHALVTTLSKGMRQKVAIACAFIHSPRVFLFDEPFIGIDPAGQRTVRQMIDTAAQQGASILISSHMLAAVENLCRRVLVINKGRLIAEGDLDQLRQRAQMGTDVSFEDVFLTLTDEGEGT